jgi:two-component system response regulator AtoC
MRGRHVLVVDDEEGIRHGLMTMFRKEGFAVDCAADAEDAAAVARQVSVDVAVVDVRLRGTKSGIDLLQELKRLEPDVVVIIITGFGSIDSAVASMKAGAADYFLKPIDNARLLDAVRRNLAMRTLATENRFLRDELMRSSLPHDFVGEDPSVRALLATADKVKDTPVTVLLTGESGTGKEVLARYIHYTGARRDGTFISINCASLSESLLLSELFGHERGAFTGAVDRKRGRFELADGGTLFLDEIGDMSLDTQAKLLRVIEEARFERVGGTKSITVDARIIAATNRDLTELIAEGRFREDLFYRVNVVSLHLAPLRDRRGDIPALVEHFLAKYRERYHRERVSLSHKTLAALQAWDWPGNVRELENTVNQIVLLGEKSFLSPSRPGARPAAAGSSRSAASGGASSARGRAGKDTLKEGLEAVSSQYERRVIAECLRRNGWNKSKAARELSITRKTLAQKIAKYELSQ